MSRFLIFGNFGSHDCSFLMFSRPGGEPAVSLRLFLRSDPCVPSALGDGGQRGVASHRRTVQKASLWTKRRFKRRRFALKNGPKALLRTCTVQKASIWTKQWPDRRRFPACNLAPNYGPKDVAMERTATTAATQRVLSHQTAVQVASLWTALRWAGRGSGTARTSSLTISRSNCRPLGRAGGRSSERRRLRGGPNGQLWDHGRVGPTHSRRLALTNADACKDNQQHRGTRRQAHC